jgi:hydrogenase maturation protein HypF
MLPYSGLHYMLFDKVNDPAFVMTSANPPNQPITKDNEEALKTLSSTVDYYLFHNRKIAHRCDDSVLRTHNGNTAFIRRSRGYAPAPIMLKEHTKHCVLALGGELNNTVCILNRDRAFISQHIGDVENVETRNFLETAAEHLINLTNTKVETIACDLHPKFTTTKLAKELATEKGWPLLQVQHHHAHIAALMAEHATNEIVGICCDGYGYGPKGEAWGGEILLCYKDVLGFKHLAHLEKQPLVGGDLATRYPLRVAAGILYGKTPIDDWLLQNKQHFPHQEKEIDIVLQQLRNRKDTIETTSCGRILDAVSAILDLCYERTYEGEPSMKLESAAVKGKDKLKLDPIIRDNTLLTTEMALGLFENKKKYPVKDLAYAAHQYLARGLATLAVEKAFENDVKVIGFSGGVAYNQIFAMTVRRIVQNAGLRFLVHRDIPAGDGGLSFGQAIASEFSQF